MEYTNVEIVTEDGEKLRGWYMAQIHPTNEEINLMNKKRRLMIFFHENAGNIGLRLDYFQWIYNRSNADILTVAYRGYSDSTGKPSEEGLQLDARAIIKYVNQNLADFYTNRGGVFIFGRSLGGAVATYAVTDDKSSMDKIDGLVLENTFTSISDMVDHAFYIISFFKSCVLRMYWPTSDRIGQVTLPILFVTGQKDEIVPHAHTL